MDAILCYLLDMDKSVHGSICFGGDLEMALAPRSGKLAEALERWCREKLTPKCFEDTWTR